MEKEHLAEVACECLHLECPEPDLAEWKKMVDDLQGENQDIMKNTYIGRRAYYTDKTALESETYDALWNILTAGAVSTVGQQ